MVLPKAIKELLKVTLLLTSNDPCIITLLVKVDSAKFEVLLKYTASPYTLKSFNTDKLLWIISLL